MEWVDSTIGGVCDLGGGEVKTGPFGSQLHQSDYEEEGIPVVMPKDIIDGYVDDSTTARVSEEHVNRLSRHKLSEGDIVYGRRGDIGRQALVRKENVGWLCGTGCLRITLGDSPVDSYFLHLYLRQPDVIKWISNQAIGATMPNLNTSILREIPVRFPKDIGYQKKLTKVISTYDDLIENNNRRIAILEDMAQSLYKEWFVKFRFPEHQNTKFKESSLGLIPEDWEVDVFTEIADVLGGGTPKTKESSYWNGEIPFFAPKDAPDSYYVSKTDKYVTELGITKSSTKLYPKDTVFITARGTVGKVVLPSIHMAMNQSCYALKAKKGISQKFLFLMTKTQVAYLKKNTGGATFDTIVTDTFKAMKVVFPHEEIIQEFDRIIEPIFDHILNLINKNSNLKSQRDLLLPKLISGKAKVD